MEICPKGEVTMAINKVCIIGTGDFSEGLKKILSKAGIQSIVREITEKLIGELQDTDLVIEALPDDLDQKKRSFQEIDKISPREAILASTTACLSIADIGAVTGRPDRVIGLNFWPFDPEAKLVQITRGIMTSDETCEQCKRLVERIDKTAVIVKDSAGLILNRVLASMINEAIFVLSYGIASRDDIDNMLKLGANFPMGPLEYADDLGLDNVLNTLESLYEELGPPYRPCPLLRKMVEAGMLGKKTKIGFYQY